MAENIPSAECLLVYKTEKKSLFPKIVALEGSLLFLKSNLLPEDKGVSPFCSHNQPGSFL